MNLDERITLSLIAAGLAIAVSFYFMRNRFRHAPLLGFTTPFLTIVLIYYYYRFITDPSQGIAILILPLTTGWLWWRREYTGKPSFSDATFVLLQVLFSGIYIALTALQTR